MLVPGLLQLWLETVRSRERKVLPELTLQLCVLASSPTLLWLQCWGPKSWWQEASSVCSLSRLSVGGGSANPEFLLCFSPLEALSCLVLTTPLVYAGSHVWWVHWGPFFLSAHNEVGAAVPPCFVGRKLRRREGASLPTVT